MEFTRILRKGMTGTDVRYMKDKLFALGYYSTNITKISSNTFGSDTVTAVKNFQSKNKDKNGRQLENDGIIGELTWNAVETASKKTSAADTTTVRFTRNLKKGMSGDDVRYMKDCLFALEYYSDSIKKISSNSFGNDTVDAVQKFQRLNNLDADGIIGTKTWSAIITAFNQGKKAPEEVKPDPTPIIVPSGNTNGILNKYTHISADKRKAIEADLAKVSDLRRTIVLEILDYAYDKDVPGDVRGLYIFGANLYDTKKQINYADPAEIEKHAKKYPDYFDGGRKEWMLKQVARNPYIPASDCSGMEVGYMRKHGLVSASFDTTANNFCTGSAHSMEVDKKDLLPGDWVGKSGHIGTYVGGGLVVEYYGGAYGCQLTKLDKREGYDFVSKRVRSGSPWTRFRRPKYY